MMKSLLVLVCSVLLFSSVHADGERLQIVLNRFDFDRVAASQKYFEVKMRKIKTAIGAAIVASLSTAGGLLYWNTYKAGEASKETELIRNTIQTLKENPDAIAKETLDKALVAQKLLNARDNSSMNHLKDSNGWLDTFVKQPLKITLWGGFALILLASGHQAFRVISGTMEDVFQLWWHGYEHWYVSYEEQVRTIMNQLRESFYQARKAAQQTATEQQLLIARQQRRAQLSYEVSSHYRLDIVSLYQRLVSALERLVALMFILSPEEHHPLMQQPLQSIQAQIARVVTSLECDLNENTHGMLTHYSNSTLDFYHECVESISIFLTTYRTYLPK